MKDFLFARLKEKSTIVTILTLIAGVAGVNLSPENKDLIVTAVVSVVSAIAAFWGEDKPE
jgi:hypothetical protein